MYRTNIPCSPAGPFAGPLVVSMRPLTPAHAIGTVHFTSRFPTVHGAPIHFGLPQAIGIPDIARPDYGDAGSDNRRRNPGLLGLRRHAASGDRDGKELPFAITHAPGLMLGDRSEEQAARGALKSPPPPPPPGKHAVTGACDDPAT